MTRSIIGEMNAIAKGVKISRLRGRRFKQFGMALRAYAPAREIAKDIKALLTPPGVPGFIVDAYRMWNNGRCRVEACKSRSIGSVSGMGTGGGDKSRFGMDACSRISAHCIDRYEEISYNA